MRASWQFYPGKICDTLLGRKKVKLESVVEDL
jgi:hypothetical protein